MRKAWLHSLKIVVVVFCYFINGVLINHALRRSTKFSWINISERNTAFIKKNESEFVLPVAFFYLAFWISSAFWENDSFEKGYGWKSTLGKQTKNHIWYLCDKLGRKRRWLGEVFISYCIYSWSFWSNCL